MNAKQFSMTQDKREYSLLPYILKIILYLGLALPLYWIIIVYQDVFLFYLVCGIADVQNVVQNTKHNWLNLEKVRYTTFWSEVYYNHPYLLYPLVPWFIKQLDLFGCYNPFVYLYQVRYLNGCSSSNIYINDTCACSLKKIYKEKVTHFYFILVFSVDECPYYEMN